MWCAGDEKMKYRKKFEAPRPTGGKSVISDAVLLGMLYVVDVRLSRSDTKEIFKHRLLIVGCEHADIERKLRWVFDASTYKEMSITGIEKVRDKVHFLSTKVFQMTPAVGPVIERDDHSQTVSQNKTKIEPFDPKLFAVGIATTMLAKDQFHALRKVGHAIVSQATEGTSHSGAALSEDSTVTIEEIPRSSGYAAPRDVSAEINRAHMVRG
jgi:hypothetical protein